MKKFRNLLFAALVAAVSAASIASAQTRVWDGASTGVGPSDASGTWDGTTSNWYNGASTAWSDGNIAQFGFSSGNTTPFTVTLGTNVAPLGIVFADQAYRIAPDSANLFGLTIGASGVTANAAAEIDAAVTLSAPQTWTAAAGQLLTVGGAVQNGGNLLTLAGAGSAAFSALAGSGGLAMSGPGLAVLSGPNIAYSGNTTVTAGTLRFVNAVNFATGSTSAPSTFTINGGATLEFNVSASGTGYNNDGAQQGIGTTAGVTITGDGTFLKTGDGVLALCGQGGGGQTVDFAMTGGTIDIEGGALKNGGWATVTWTNNLASLNVGANGLFDIWDGKPVYVDALTGSGIVDKRQTGGGVEQLHVGVNNGSGVFTGVIQNSNTVNGTSLGFYKEGSGTQVLSGANTYNGPTLVNGGTLVITDPLGLQNSTVDTSGAGLLAFGANTAETMGALQGTGNLSLVNSTGQGIVLTTGGNNVNTTFSGALTDGGAGASLVKVGNGAMSLSGSVNSFTGGATLNAGTLIATNPGALPYYGSAGSVSVAVGATLAVNAGGSGEWLARNIDSLLGAVAFPGGSNFGIQVTAGNAFSYGTSIAGPQGFVKLGGGMLGLTGNNTYAGPTTVSSGMLAPASAAALPGYNTLGAVSVAVGAGLVLPTGDGTTGWSSGQIDSVLLNTSFGTTSVQPGVTAYATLGIDTTSGDFTYGTAITQSLALTKLGANTLHLTGASNYPGPTTAAAGTLDVAAGGSLNGTNSLTAVSGGAITVSGSVTVADGGLFGVGYDVPGTGAVVVNSGGVLNVGNGGGRVFVGGSNNDGNNGSGTLTVNAGGLLNVAAPGAFPNDMIYLAGYGGSGVFNLNGGTLCTARGIGTGGTNVFNFNGGLLQATAVNVNINGGLSLYVQAGGAAIDTNGYNMTVSSSLLDGGGGLTKLGSGTLNLNAQASYSGATTVANGTLQLNVGGQTATLAGSGAININSGGVLLGGTTDALGYYNQNATNVVNINEGGTLSVVNGSRLSMDRTVNCVGGTIASQGGGDSTGATYTFRDSAGGLFNFTSAPDGTPATISATAAGLNGNATFNVTQGGGPVDLLVSGTLVDNFGTGNLIKAGNGTMVLAAANTYSGNTTLNAGTLVLANSSTLATSTLVPNGGTLVFSSSVSGNAFVLGGLSAGNSGPSYDIALQNDTAAAIALTVGQNNASTAYAGVLSGSGSLIKVGNGTLTLSATNTYSGGTTVNGGLLQVFGDAQLGAVPSSPTVNVTLNGGQLFNNSSSPDYNSNRTFYLGPNGGFVRSGWGATTTIEGQITGPGGFGVVWDGGPVVLTNSGNNYAGDTTIGAVGNSPYTPGNARLDLGVDNAIPSGPGAGNLVFLADPDANHLGNPAVLNLNGHNAQINGLTGGATAYIDNYVSGGSCTLTVGNNDQSSTFGGTIQNSQGSIALTKTGSGTLTLTGVNTYSGPTTVNAGALQLGDGVSNNGSLAGGIVNNASLVFANPLPQTFSGVVSGNGSLTKTGPGTLTLNANSTYAGATLVSGGTLQLTPLCTTNISVGGATNPGSYSLMGNSLTITGAGNDFWGGTQQGFYAYEAVPTSQNFDVAVHISTMAGGDGTWAKAGIMARQDASNNSVSTLLDAETTGAGVAFQWCDGSQNNGTGSSTGPNWLRMTYDASTGTFVGYESPSSSPTVPAANDPSWVQINSYVVPMSGSTFLLGIADTAHNNGATNTAIFDNVASLVSLGNNVLPANTPIVLATNAALDLNGDNQQVASLSDLVPGSGGSVINGNTGLSSLLTLSSTGGSTTFSGSIGGGTAGAVSLIMSGSGTQILEGSILGPGSVTVDSGTLVLSGRDTYAGATTVSGGTLVVTNGSALPQGAALTVGAGGVFIFDPSQVVSSDSGSGASGSAVSGIAAVPEPSTFALLTAGALAGLAVTWRKRTVGRNKRSGGPAEM